MHVQVSHSTIERARPASAGTRMYIAAWVLGALVAVGYLATLATRPDLATTHFPDLRKSDARARVATGTAIDVDTMRATIAQLNMELAEAKASASSNESRVMALETQLAALQPKAAAGATATVAAEPAASPASAIARKFADAKSTDPTAATKATVKTVSAEEILSANPTLINSAGQPSTVAGGVETGSISAPKPPSAAAAAAPVVFGPAVVKPAAPPVGIRIATGPNLDSLRLSWSLLSDRHAPTLKNLEARYVTGGDEQNPAYDLVAGPLKSKAEAVRVCRGLQSKGVPCSVGGFDGEAL